MRRAARSLIARAPDYAFSTRLRENELMPVSAKVDWAVRAAVELAVAGGDLVKGEQLSQAQGIPLKFLENILIELRQAGLIRSQRGPEGGYWLARSPAEIIGCRVVPAGGGGVRG